MPSASSARAPWGSASSRVSCVRAFPPASATSGARPRTQARALGAACDPSPASLVRACDVSIILVVDAPQVETVLFGPEGSAAALPAGHIVMLASTVDPDYVAALAPRVAAHGGVLIDAPVSGGPRRAADGTMTMMVAGDDAARARCGPVLDAIAGKVFHVGPRAGDAARFKIVNNLLAAVNLAAGAEALALAAKAGLDPALVVDVVNASSGGSWIFADRMPRALAGDYAPRAAARILTKDVGIAVEFARRHGAAVPFAEAAHAAFAATVAAGLRRGGRCGDLRAMPRARRPHRVDEARRVRRSRYPRLQSEHTRRHPTPQPAEDPTMIDSCHCPPSRQVARGCRRRAAGRGNRFRAGSQGACRGDGRRDVRRRLFLVHGAALRQAPRRDQHDVRLHGRHREESDVRGRSRAAAPGTPKSCRSSTTRRKCRTRSCSTCSGATSTRR